tara:strand:+ start:616 stop:1353 length:738 start_codon:yes stop_codon:yes gene_type:complete
MNPLIVANWKLNPESVEEAKKLYTNIDKKIQGVENVDTVICPPFVYLPEIVELRGNVPIGAQDAFWEETGAFTSEASPQMIKELGCTHVILGHSDRRKHLGETFEMVQKKVPASIEEGLIPVVCIGEQTRDQQANVLSAQMKIVLGEVKDASSLVCVYEPEWAISSNDGAEPAIPERVSQSIDAMQEILKEMFGDVQIPILYGGSVNSSNIQSFLSQGKAQGALVGSASLNADEFAQVVTNASLL